MVNNSSQRRLITIFASVVFGIVVLCLVGLITIRRTVEPDAFLFNSIKGTEIVGQNTYQFRTGEGEVSLVHLKTQNILLIPASIRLTENDTCEECVRFISVPQQDPYITFEFATQKTWPCEECIFQDDIEYVDYLITRQHNGGSGGYYMHHVYEVNESELTEKGAFLSCGNVYSQNYFLVFSSHVDSCPEFGETGWFIQERNWQDEIFHLRDN